VAPRPHETVARHAAGVVLAIVPGSCEQSAGARLAVRVGAPELMPLYRYHARFEAGEPLVGEDRPFAAFDVDLDEVGCRLVEKVDDRDVDAVLAVDGHSALGVHACREPHRPGRVRDGRFHDLPLVVRCRGVGELEGIGGGQAHRSGAW
jgi:hypothetical protein